MSNQNPLDLPEIRLRIAEYLQKPDLFNCLFVNKAWYDFFVPLVWRTIQIYYRQATHKIPPLEHLERHRQYVREFQVQSVDLNLYAFNYPNLHRLVFRRDVLYVGWGGDHDMSPFLKLNPSLVEVQLADHISSNSSNSNYIGTLAELPHLKLLILENVSIHEDNLDDCYRLFEKLETFRTASFDIAKHIAFDNIKFQRMRHLHLSPLLRYNEAGLLELMKAFPRIEHLHVTAPPRGIVCLFQNKTWSNLRGITLKMRLKDSDLEHVLRGIDRGTDLTFGLMNFGPLAFQALSLHFPTLTKLVIATCNDVTSIMVRDILCSCPCLEHFQAKTVKAKDIVEGGDWACNSLRVLFVHIEFSESEQSLQPKIFQRLSSLVLLCSLSIGLDNYRSGETLSYGLDIRLSKGLQLLSTLKQLRYLNVKGTIQSVGENDAKWISENLKSLKQFYGWRNNTHRDLNNSIQKMFDQCGINKFMR